MTKQFREAQIEFRFGEPLELKYSESEGLSDYYIIVYKDKQPCIYKMLKQKNKAVTQSGKTYKFISVTINGKGKKLAVHRLVLFSIGLPNPDQKPFVNHKDCNPSNNSFDNLEWCTHKENIAHARINSRMPSYKGDKNPNSVLTKKVVLKILSLRKKGLVYTDIADKLNTSLHNVCLVLTGKNWSSVTGIEYQRKTKKILLNYKGRLVTLKEASLLFGVHEDVIRRRVKYYNWDHARAIESPSERKKVLRKLSRPIKEGEG